LKTVYLCLGLVFAASAVGPVNAAASETLRFFGGMDGVEYQSSAVDKPVPIHAFSECTTGPLHCPYSITLAPVAPAPLVATAATDLIGNLDFKVTSNSKNVYSGSLRVRHHYTTTISYISVTLNCTNPDGKMTESVSVILGSPANLQFAKVDCQTHQVDATHYETVTLSMTSTQGQDFSSLW
jgi:hypothetical protein